MPPSLLVPTGSGLSRCQAELSERQGTAHSTGEEEEGVVMGPGGRRYLTLALASTRSPSAGAGQVLALRSKGAKVGTFTVFNLRYMDRLQLLLSAGEGLNPGPALPVWGSLVLIAWA